MRLGLATIRTGHLYAIHMPMLEEMKNITFQGETVPRRGVLKEADIPAFESLANRILA